ncbi:hypothetical protein HPB50_012646 [Hyalomma asiaticum]|uniref:Uncharacterized protein n=1 Tax=Hyalomma asiaticum TaxID=266040 RepID=A0ACB7SVS5_HYAAI|nr:hypothetical protein HPB50_012646 [Hyalomma asiaticum]
MAAQKGAKNNSAKKPATRQPTHVTGGDDSPRQNDVNSAQAPPSGIAEKRGAAALPPPHGGQGNQSRSQPQQPKVQGAGDARASPIKNDKKAHFEESSFEQHRADGWKKLKPNAAPSVFAFTAPPRQRKPPKQRAVPDVPPAPPQMKQQQPCIFSTADSASAAEHASAIRKQ